MSTRATILSWTVIDAEDNGGENMEATMAEVTKLQRLMEIYQHEEDQTALDDYMQAGRAMIVSAIGNEAGELIGLPPEDDSKSERVALMKAIIALNNDLAAKGSDIVVSEDDVLEFSQELFEGRSR